MWEISPKQWRVYCGSSRPSIEKFRRRYPGVNLAWEGEPAIDWAARYQETVAPLCVGRRFVVLPSEKIESPWKERISIRLVPGCAFGTGEHYTTASCLRAWEGLPATPKSVFDVGCGSGILAVAAFLDGCPRVVACDNDPEACRVANETAALNGAGVTILTGSAGDVDESFDCVFANILAETLAEIFPDLCARVSPGGFLIGSGISSEKGTDINNIAIASALEVFDKRSDGEWWTFTWRKQSPLSAGS
jgi:ribosomal protein L11 methyltransferase